MTVSFIIPCYNYGRFVGDAIESILGQSYADVEVIVVDDGSTDDSAAIIGRYPGVKLIRIANSGIAVARNTGTQASRGEFLWFLDADDMLAPGALQSSVEVLEARPECGFVYGHETAIGDNGPEPSGGLSPGKCMTGDLYEQLLAANDALRSPSSVMHRRSIFETIGGFTDRLYGCEDFDMHLRVLREHPVACNDSVVLIKRNHGDNLSGNWGKMLKGAVRAQREQKPFVEAHPKYRAAYEAGMRVARGYNSSKLERQIVRKAASRTTEQLGSDVMTLMRYDPARMAMLPARLLRRAVRRLAGRSN